MELTIFSLALRTPNLPKRTWNGDETKVPSACSTTMTSMAPVNVAGLISLYHCFKPDKTLLTLCKLILIGVFFWIAVSSVAPIGLFMAGYGSNNKYAFLGGLRAIAQSIRYELPLALCVLAITVISDDLSTISIVEKQSIFGILSWNIWKQPIGFLAFLIACFASFRQSTLTSASTIRV